MGSKRALLRNGLGDVLDEETQGRSRFVDLFAGTGRVSWHVAESFSVPVVANDLQEYATLLAAAVIERTEAIDADIVERRWLEPTRKYLRRSTRYRNAQSLVRTRVTATAVKRARRACAEEAGGPIWEAYGGHYYSPAQASAIDALLHFLPGRGRLRTLCRASLVLAASRCAAAPGHTAQPFQPTESALPYITAAWSLDPLEASKMWAERLALKHALVRGRAVTRDANALARSAQPGDLVFIDPPYSAVQYSRFYHVLETIARGRCGPVEGVGRYPPAEERPRSDYSVLSLANASMATLLETLGERGCRVVVTFPQERASNGIEGEELVEMARESFRVDASVLSSHFSTLGGNNGNRSARRRSNELIIRLRPRD